MSRSSKKFPFVCPNLYNKVLNPSFLKSQIKTRSRSSTIYPIFVNRVIYVYNGKAYVPVSITESMIFEKLGAYCPTKKFAVHAVEKKNNNPVKK